MINIAIMGFGVVGGGVYDVIEMNSSEIRDRIGKEINVKYILDLRDFPGTPYESKVVKDFNIILNDPEVSIVVETMGGSHPAYDFSKSALMKGKSVVTSNKEVVANFGSELLKIASENNAHYYFEASVGGGIPLIRPLRDAVAGDVVEAVAGIMNGTTNYILTRMSKEGATFEDALKEAQAKGFAEKDPTADIEGIDNCRKICILSDIAYGKNIDPKSVSVKGITKISLDDFDDAKKWGGEIKLLGFSKRENDGIYIIVCPFFVKNDKILANIQGVNNGVCVYGRAVGEVMFYGPGAGKLPTASAVVGDVVWAAARLGEGATVSWVQDEATDFVLDSSLFESEYYVRLSAMKDDQEAVIKALPCASVLSQGESSISFIFDKTSEATLDKTLSSLCGVSVESKIRVFGV